MNRRSLVFLVLLMAVASSASAGDVNWVGAESANTAATVSDTDVGNSDLWYDGTDYRLPGTDDRAIFIMQGGYSKAISTVADTDVPAIEGVTTFLSNRGSADIDFGAADPGRTPTSVVDAINAIFGATGMSATTTVAQASSSLSPLTTVQAAEGPVTFEGNRGSDTVTFVLGSGTTTVRDLINSISATTGVVATSTSTAVTIRSESGGSNQFLKITVPGGSTFGASPLEAYGTGGTITISSEFAGKDQLLEFTPAGGAAFAAGPNPANGTGFRGEFTLPSGAVFAPGDFTVGHYGSNVTHRFNLDKDLTVGIFGIDHVYNGTSAMFYLAAGRTLTATSSYNEMTDSGNPLSIVGTGGTYASISLGAGATLDFTGSPVWLYTPQSYYGGGAYDAYLIGGAQGFVKFAAAATVNLDNPFDYLDGNLAIGANGVLAASTTVWNNPSGVGFIRAAMRRGVSGGYDVTKSFASGSLNMSAVPLVLDSQGNNVGDMTSVDAARIEAGTYKGIAAHGYHNGAYLAYAKLMGDVELVDLAVFPGSRNATEPNPLDPDDERVKFASVISDCSLEMGCRRLDGGSANGMPVDTSTGVRWILDLAGYQLKTAHGVKLRDDSRLNQWGRCGSRIFVNEGTLDVGGDLVVVSKNASAALGNNAGVTEFCGLYGGTGANGTVLLRGDYSNNCIPTPNGMYKLDLYMVGGTAAVKTYEVGNKGTDTVVAGNHAVASFNVGRSAGSPLDGKARLVSNDPNNKTTSAGEEILVCGALAVQTTPSELDLNGLGVDVLGNADIAGLLDVHGSQLYISGALNIAGGTMKVNGGTVQVDTSLAISSGLDLTQPPGSLTDGDLIMNFLGTGDQVANWTASADHVYDSNNENWTFTAVTTTVEMETVTVWKANSPPGGQLEITAATISPDWAFQNTASTVVNVHYGLLTVTVNDTWGNTSYTVTVTKAAGPGDVTVAAGANDLQKRLYGSLRTDGVTGTGTCQFSVQVVGDVGGDVTGAVSTTFKVRRLGDINDDDAVTTDDSVWLTKKLNNLDVTPLVLRDFDVTGDGFVTTDDDVLLTKILNNLAIP